MSESTTRQQPTPAEVSSLIRESWELLRSYLVGGAVFGLVAWLLAGSVAWLSAAALVLAIVGGLGTLWHLAFLIRSALLFADLIDLDIAAREEADRFPGRWAE